MKATSPIDYRPWSIFGRYKRPAECEAGDLFELFSLIAGQQHFWCPVLDILLAALLMLYLAPTMDAHDRAHPNALRISLLNVFLGWTVVGWVVALVWARTISPVEFYAARNRRRYLAARWVRTQVAPQGA